MVLLILFILGSPGVLWAQTSLSLPVASTVDVVSEDVVRGGAVVRYDEIRDRYTLTDEVSDPTVYGVVADRPAIVFVTATTSVPVVTQGVTEVLVNMENGQIVRGDVLTTSSIRGQAMRATDDGHMVFAIALEAMDEAGLLSAQIGVEEAQTVWAKRNAVAGTADDGKVFVSMARAVIAAALVLVAIGFLLYSFRSVMTTGVISVGRNPRARQSVLGIAVGSMVLVVIVTTLVVFVAVGILILPV